LEGESLNNLIITESESQRITVVGVVVVAVAVRIDIVIVVGVPRIGRTQPPVDSRTTNKFLA
jgi:hypothetical protein